MEPVTVAAAAGNTIVDAVGTDSWRQAVTEITGWWQRFRPAEVATIEAELVEVRDEMLAAAQESGTATAAELSVEWKRKFQRLLRSEPEAEPELRRLLEERLQPLIPPERRQQIGQVTMTATAHDSSRIYQSAGDMTINES
ncbi:hypothetical protein [Actinoalloteichus hymeniacidonis]|uniref:Uncharacterized protein n=1 Tax=Actinoalloteichus hymeniacidonis TaxID=340345 RepID=A0AAC9MWS8_9PSEU|nr:hypothetical protein [Actinoalloteichus hymeniacidonis]AOS61469.1 hypothetical protein TL08_03175 [Actinoalloteichus hymeniacidonis]MBB5910524.1 transketolase [Actinoalloteichus hymeniacidonis]